MGISTTLLVKWSPDTLVCVRMKDINQTIKQPIDKGNILYKKIIRVPPSPPSRYRWKQLP